MKKKYAAPVTIEKLVFGGYGLAHTDSGVIFVEQSAPGDRVTVEGCGKRGGVPVGKITSFVQQSALRRKAPCRYAGLCGGCDWQHLHYPAQVEAKRMIYEECLKRIGRIETIPELEVYQSPEFGYRSRVQLKVDREHSALGFFRRQSNDVVAIRQCPLLSGGLHSLLQNPSDILEKLPADCHQIKAIEGDNARVASYPVLDNLTCPQTSRAISGITFTLDGDGFFQSNRFLLEKLGNWVRKAGKGTFFIDMYGGTGFFASHAAHQFESGVLVENITALSRKAEQTFSRNGFSHIKTETLSAETFFKKRHYSAYRNPDCLIVDPPRPGLTRVVREGIRDLAPRKILYISCNPSTQARDMGFFLNKCGYHLENLALFDLYPQTHHIETAALLKLA
ncbi:MAG: class I SAM-dependent RNA methyltransferase [Chitinispirillaceae bacterium]